MPLLRALSLPGPRSVACAGPGSPFRSRGRKGGPGPAEAVHGTAQGEGGLPRPHQGRPHARRGAAATRAPTASPTASRSTAAWLPVSTDAGLEAFLAEMRGKPVYMAFQAEGREWVRLFSAADAREVRLRLHRRDDVERRQRKRMRLWIADEVGTIADRQAFMDTLVARADRHLRQRADRHLRQPDVHPGAVQPTTTGCGRRRA